MSDTIINPSTVNIYGVNSFINKFEDNDNEIIVIDTLKSLFDVDFKYDDKVHQIQEANMPAFTQLTYNKREKTGDSSFSVSYNRPPLGPIDKYCYCNYCQNISPKYHTEDCPFPEKKSLYLTIKGVYYYIIQNKKETFSSNINSLKEAWLNNNITQSQLNTILLIPNSFTADKVNTFKESYLDNTITKIKYLDIVKTRGPSKLSYTTATEKFSNAIMLSYEYGSEDNIKKTSIRIYKNGLINLINVPSDSKTRNILYNTLIKKINEHVDDVINIDSFNEIASEYTSNSLEEFEEYTIINSASYIHSVNSQFNMWQPKDKYSIDFVKLNNLISPFDSSGRIVSGEFTNVVILPKLNKQIIELNYDDKSVYIVNWEYTLNNEIKCVILPIDGIKISLQIHTHGIFQMSMSYCNTSDIKNAICTKVLNKNLSPLNYDFFDIVKTIFTGIFTDKPFLYGESLDYSDESTSLIRNTVSGKAPPNKPGTSTAVCRNKSSDAKLGNPSIRPIPYSELPTVIFP